jgi:hypothetical protein
VLKSSVFFGEEKGGFFLVARSELLFLFGNRNRNGGKDLKKSSRCSSVPGR